METTPNDVLSGLVANASIRPQLLSCGNWDVRDAGLPTIPQLQFGHSFSAVETTLAAGIKKPQKRGFNSATASQLWKHDHAPRQMKPPSKLQFGHSFSAVETSSTPRPKTTRSTKLQFGHSFSAVETAMPFNFVNRATDASIRPQLLSCGNCEYALCNRSNGAASIRPQLLSCGNACLQ